MDFMRLQETEITNLRTKVTQLDEEMENLMHDDGGHESRTSVHNQEEQDHELDNEVTSDRGSRESRHDRMLRHNKEAQNRRLSFSVHQKSRDGDDLSRDRGSEADRRDEVDALITGQSSEMAKGLPPMSKGLTEQPVDTGPILTVAPQSPSKKSSNR